MMKNLLNRICLLTALLTITLVANAAEVASVTIDGAQNMTFGADPNTAYKNAYTLVVKDAAGTSLTEESLKSGAKDFKVTWDVAGFKTENDTEGQYCDSYGSFSVNGAASTATTFDLRNVPMNFYGVLTATVTYNGATFKAEKYVVALGNKTKNTNQVLPLAGYPVNFSVYPDALNNYVVSKDTYGTLHDVILGGWCVAGSDSKSSGTLMKDADGTKYVRLTAGTTKKSHVLTMGITSPVGQVMFSELLRFNGAGATVTLTSRYPFWSSNSGYTNPVTLDYDGTNILLNGVKLKNGNADAVFSSNKWYKILLSVDKSTEKCYVFVYDTNGAQLGASELTAWKETSVPTYFSIGMGNAYSTGSVDIASCEAYLPTVDDTSYQLSADKTTLSIPNGDTAVLTASVKDANGHAVTQLATWKVLEDDMRSFVSVTPSANDSHTATVTLAEGAEAGTVTVQVSIGGYTKNIALTLTSSAESVRFTQSDSGITIPFEDGATATASFAAITVDGMGNDLARTVTLAAYEKDGVTPFVNTKDISFNAKTGVLTVTAAALPTMLVVTATSVNSDNEPLSKSVLVNIHGMKFDFGYTQDEAVAAGFTFVGTQSAYDDNNGYGIVSGTPTVAGTASATNAESDYLQGAMQFDFKVKKGEFYTVSVTYLGKLTTGYINSDLAGYTLGTQAALTTVEYTIPATRDVIDLHIAAADATGVARIAQVTVTKQAKRTKRTKPVVHHIGDSTSANNGSWAKRLGQIYAEDYPELAQVCVFKNNGAGGRNLCTYYAEGKLAPVLNDIYPGDILMFGNNGTNGMGKTFEEDMNYYLDAAETLGAKIIINSYTPHGAVAKHTAGYDSSTATFDSYRRDAYDVAVRKVAAERETNDPNYIGFVEIGKNADAIFNAYAADYANNEYASADAAAQAIITCFTDHNHYSNGTLACDLMLGGYETASAKGIVAQLVNLLNGGQGTKVAKVVKVQEKEKSIVYDILGRRVSSTGVISGNGKRLYVIDGKKVMIE